MSPELGYAGFEDPPLFGAAPIFDGVQLTGIPLPLEKNPSWGAHLLQHASGDVTLQIDYRADVDPATLDRYEFTFPLRATDQTNWWNLERVRKGGRRVYLVTFDAEEEVFDVGVSLAAFRLPRPPASSVLSVVTFPDLASVPILAWLDDVEQDVISSGTPAEGEVKVVGRDVTTPTLTAGQVLRIRYVPAYLVAVSALPQRLSQFNALDRQVTLSELRASD